MIQFYLPDIATDPRLPEEESGHCVRVLRMKEGDELQAVDGKGTRYHCRLTKAHNKHSEVEVLSCESEEKHWGAPIEVAVAPTKNTDRMEWMTEKCVELGIDRIVPVRCRHSERKELKTERLRKIAVSAMKQSLKSYLPDIEPLTPLEAYLAEESCAQKFICYCDKETERKDMVCEVDPSRPVRILIGPEGDFSPEEVEAACRAGYQPVTLGESRLRTETAAMVAVADIHARRRLARFSGVPGSEACGPQQVKEK